MFVSAPSDPPVVDRGGGRSIGGDIFGCRRSNHLIIRLSLQSFCIYYIFFHAYIYIIYHCVWSTRTTVVLY